jgi:hypothetical protein
MKPVAANSEQRRHYRSLLNTTTLATTSLQHHDTYIVTNFRAPASFNKGTNFPFLCIVLVSARKDSENQFKCST